MTELSTADAPATVNKWAAVAVLLLANFMNLIDITIVNVAMPSMQSELSAAPNLIEWIIAGYTFSFALLLLPAGRMGDLFGRRRLFMAGIVVFTLASLVCGLSPGTGTLVTARVVQGVGAAIMMPQTLALVPALFPPAQRGAAFGLFALTAGLASVTGPILGGVLINADIMGLTWRPIFLVNIPVGILALVGALVLVPRGEGNRKLGVDTVGIVLAGLAMLAVLVPLVEAPSIGWRLWMWPMVLVAPFLGWGFVRWQALQESRGAPQLLPLRLARSDRFLKGGALNAALFSAVPSYFFTIALYLQSGFGLSPLQSGLTTTPFPVGVLAASVVTGWFGSRWVRWRVLGGGLLLGTGFVGQAWAVWHMGAQISWLQMAPWFLIGGFGMGNTVSPLYQLALSAAEADDTGSASGAVQAIRQIGIAFGVAIMGGIFFAVLGGAQHGDQAAYRIAMLAAIGYACVVAAVLVTTPLLTRMSLPES